MVIDMSPSVSNSRVSLYPTHISRFQLKESFCSYVEGLDVLYHTNTIHIDSLFLTYHLSELILPQRLTSITALEFVWDFTCFFRAWFCGMGTERVKLYHSRQCSSLCLPLL